MSQNIPGSDPLGSLLPVPVDSDTRLNTRTMATTEPTTGPVAEEPETPQVSTSAAATTSQAPSPTAAPRELAFAPTFGRASADL